MFVHQKRISSLVAKRMAHLGVSQVQLAAHAGICRSHLIGFLQNEKQLGTDKLARIMKVLRLTLKVEGGRPKAEVPVE